MLLIWERREHGAPFLWGAAEREGSAAHLRSLVRIVVLSPHRDDAAFSSGLAIEAWLARKHRVTVLNCFTESAYAPFSDAESLHPNDRKSFVTAIRRKEDVAWNKLLRDRLDFHDLTLLDAPLRLACSADEVLTVEIRPGDRAVARVRGAIEKLLKGAGAGQVALVAPLAVGGHIDHRVVRQATLEAVSGTGPPLAFYEDLPYAARPGASEQPASLAQEAQLDLHPVFGQTAAVDDVGAIRRKHAFAECYDSQIDSDDVRLIAEFARPLGGRERLWANPAWRASELGISEELSA